MLETDASVLGLGSILSQEADQLTIISNVLLTCSAKTNLEIVSVLKHVNRMTWSFCFSEAFSLFNCAYRVNIIRCQLEVIRLTSVAMYIVLIRTFLSQAI